MLHCSNLYYLVYKSNSEDIVVELQVRLQARGMSNMGDHLRCALVTLHIKNLSSVWVDWLSDFSFFLSY